MENASYFLAGLIIVAVIVIVALLKGGVSIGSLTLTLGKIVIKDLRITGRLEDRNRKN
jgi:hypothetical protein